MATPISPDAAGADPALPSGEASAALLAAQQRRVEAMLSGLAHDLRNPLAPLANGLELLRMADGDAAGRARTRAILERQVTHLMRIADRVTELSRLHSDRPGLASAEFSLGELAAGLQEAAAPLLLAADVALEIDAGAAATVLHGDPARVAQALQDLVEEVAARARPGSVLGLRTWQHDEFAWLSFGSLTAEPPTEAAEEARPPGLRASVAGKLLELQGAGLLVRRPSAGQPGGFTVRWPAARPGPLARAPAAAPLPQAAAQGLGAGAGSDASLSVLVADDNVDFARSFATMLELLGHRVAVVHDGAAAVQALAAAPSDIAFVDLGLPSMDGLEVASRLRGMTRLRDLWIVAVTGRHGAEDRARAIECGFNRYLVKPFSMQDVRDALEAVAAARAERTSAA